MLGRHGQAAAAHRVRRKAERIVQLQRAVTVARRVAPGHKDALRLDLSAYFVLQLVTDLFQKHHRHFRHCRPSRDRHPRRLCDLPFKGDLLVPQARHDLFHTRLIGEKRMQIREVFDRKRFVFLDGGMGTQLQSRGLRPGQKPELAALEMPEV